MRVSRSRNSLQPVSRWRIIAAGFLFIALFCQLGVRLSVTRTGFEIERTRQAALENDLALRKLDLEYASASRPADIRKRAGQDLQMLPVEMSAVRHVKFKGMNRGSRGEQVNMAFEKNSQGRSL
jgi:hypothetical protein